MSSNVTVVGNLTRDPELRFTPAGAPVTTFGVAVNRRWQNRDNQQWEESTSFFNVTCWRDLAQNVSESLEKGARVVVTGRLEQRSWETQDGERRSVVEIVADKIPALDSVNDVIQTFVRPTSGGIVFGSGTAAETHAVTDPGAFAQSGQWIPIVVGVLVALVVSLTKSAVRPAANVATAGVAAPVLSTIEDGVSVGLVFVAILIPVVVLVVLALLGWAFFKLWRRRRNRARADA